MAEQALHERLWDEHDVESDLEGPARMAYRREYLHGLRGIYARWGFGGHGLEECSNGWGLWVPGIFATPCENGPACVGDA
jgi:hypothetical protein